ncbi:hypothetical protein PCC8801_0017 [Rippkaea orientalis PCC 8801]|uniref:Uncharacterized protein n=1 Tax=Rippkaea orientalis (strain PCC 8801 / RF-1) TaxID=41431 RepID=B7JZG4_RIPO1|nr:hypothetical protein [Rippkaea orientalis]ACK64124.1 hypothetical protein PCC8801_0017 [Rippkaea orientalis PCC 8801]
MKIMFKAVIPIIALVGFCPVTLAQTKPPISPLQRAANNSLNYASPYKPGTVTGVVSGPYGSILFVELEDKTKLRFHHPSTRGIRGDRVLVLQKNEEYFLIESANPK